LTSGSALFTWVSATSVTCAAHTGIRLVINSASAIHHDVLPYLKRIAAPERDRGPRKDDRRPNPFLNDQNSTVHVAAGHVLTMQFTKERPESLSFVRSDITKSKHYSQGLPQGEPRCFFIEMCIR
jgi:hypothetical protein